MHLGALARHLRLLGFDTRWRNDLEDEAIIAMALAGQRIILTRDRGILRDGRVPRDRPSFPDERAGAFGN